MKNCALPDSGSPFFIKEPTFYDQTFYSEDIKINKLHPNYSLDIFDSESGNFDYNFILKIIYL